MISHLCTRLGMGLGAVLAVWWAVVLLAAPPPFLLPDPHQVAQTLWEKHTLLLHHAGVTLTEILLGFALGAGAGILLALALFALPRGGQWLLPILIASQALPVFALAPLLVLWAGYGMASKVIMAALTLFFAVTANFYEGLQRTPPALLDLAHTLRGRRRLILWRIRIPAALPHLAAGLRIAAVYAPVGAVVGEWVGSGAGLGYLMLQANGRMQTDLLFAALAVLLVMTLTFYTLVDRALRWLIPMRRSTHEQ
jgi:putative hydroxymethylpyrimidine transport system permease protein